MSSRQEEKQRRRQEREAAERAEDAVQARRRRVRIVAAVAAGALALVVVAAVVLTTGGNSTPLSSGSAASRGYPAVTLAAAKETDLQRAAKTAKCLLRNSPSEGRTHTRDRVTYKTNPPTSGAHNPVPAQDGVYAPDNPPSAGSAVHALEHGRVLLQYRPGLPAEQRGLLKAVFDDRDGYHALLFANQTQMTPAVAVTAWTRSLNCPDATRATADAVRAFRKAYTDKGPEFIP